MISGNAVRFIQPAVKRKVLRAHSDSEYVASAFRRALQKTTNALNGT